MSPRALAFFFLLYLLALTFPVYGWFGGIEPRVLGLPFSFAWVILWVVLGWGALIATYARDRRQS